MSRKAVNVLSAALGGEATNMDANWFRSGLPCSMMTGPSWSTGAYRGSRTGHVVARPRVPRRGQLRGAGTGRDVNNLRDAGDVMAILCELKVDVVLSGRRHVPYEWSTLRGARRALRHRVDATRRHDAAFLQRHRDRRGRGPCRDAAARQGVQGEEHLARFARVPVTTSEFDPALARFVRYDADPIDTASHPADATSAPAHSAGAAAR
jgi:hypothetical protein